MVLGGHILMQDSLVRSISGEDNMMQGSAEVEGASEEQPLNQSGEEEIPPPSSSGRRSGHNSSWSFFGVIERIDKYVDEHEPFTAYWPKNEDDREAVDVVDKTITRLADALDNALSIGTNRSMKILSSLQSDYIIDNGQNKITEKAMGKLIEQLRKELENDPEYIALFNEGLKDSKQDEETIEEVASHVTDGELARHLIYHQGSLDIAKKSIVEAMKWKRYYLSQELEVMGIRSSESSPSESDLGILAASILKKNPRLKHAATWYGVDCHNRPVLHLKIGSALNSCALARDADFCLLILLIEAALGNSTLMNTFPQEMVSWKRSEKQKNLADDWKDCCSQFVILYDRTWEDSSAVELRLATVFLDTMQRRYPSRIAAIIVCQVDEPAHAKTVDDANGADLSSIEEEWCLVIESTLKRPTPITDVIGQVSHYKSASTEPWKPSPILFFPSLAELTELIPFPNLPYDFRHALATGSEREKHHALSHSEDADDQQDTESKVGVLKHDIEKLLLSAANRKSKTATSKKKSRTQGDSTSFQILGDDDEDITDYHVEGQSESDLANVKTSVEEISEPLEVEDTKGVSEEDKEIRNGDSVQVKSVPQQQSQESEVAGTGSVAAFTAEEPTGLIQEEQAHEPVPDIEDLEEADENGIPEIESKAIVSQGESVSS